MKMTFEIDKSSFENKVKATLSGMIYEAGLLEQTINAIKKESLMEVPRDTGTLADSCFSEITRTFTSVTGFVGYRGGTYNLKSRASVSDYVVVVHEDLTRVHKNGKAKFLEDPFRRNTLDFNNRFGTRINKMLSSIWRP